MKLHNLKDEFHELEDEQKQIIYTNVCFTCFLKQNAITPYNDAMIVYLEYLIRTNEGKAEVADRLRNVREQYTNEIKLLDARIKAPNSP